MSDPKASLPAVPAAKPGTASPPPPAGAVAGHGAAKPGAAPVAAGQSVPLFGGHRGGGKRREDGLPAGSPEAKAADREKDRQRKQAARAASRGAAIPAPLPSAPAAAPAPAADSPAAVAGGASAVPAVAPAAGVAVVLWNPRLLEKPARLVTRIIDRLRSAALAKKLDHPKLPADMRAEIKRDIALPPEALADFSNALADCAAVELNKRGVGAGQSHWLTLAGSVVELGAHHVATMERLDKLIAKLDEEKPEPPKAQTEGGK